MFLGVAWFAGIFAGLFILRGILVTWLFLALLPPGTRCPLCNEITLRIRSRGWNSLLPWFRTSWCPHCGWEGLLRNSAVPEPVELPVPARHVQPR